MFKKRSRPVNARDKAAEASASPLAGAAADGADEAETSTETLQELLLLRKYGKQQAGIDLLKLNQGEQKKKPKKKKDDEEADETEAYGLQKKVPAGGGEDESDGDNEEKKAKRLVRANNFTQQTNALDVDKHMMAYIETELAKRRGIDPSKPQEGEKEYDPQEELFRIAEKYRVEKKEAPDDEEGNVTTSMGMLTSIPEVDLGMDVRLRNIEETEKAKRAMIEARKKGSGKKREEADQNFAAARFYRPNYKVQSDTEALEDARREAMDLPPINRTRRPGGESVEVATDEAVYERFKKRIRKN